MTPPHTLLLFLSLGLAAPGAEAPKPDSVPNGILLVTSPELAPAWREFADWKTRLGKPTKVVTTAAIAKTCEGADLQEKIRRRVRKGIESEGIRWVILGGDSQPDGAGQVPDRDTMHKTRWGTNTGIPTDIFYLSKGSWDADGDGIYGEWEDDREAIDYPDGTIGLGRIPVRTVADVSAYTAKVIAYESKYPVTKFARTFTYTCPEPGAYPKLRTGWKRVVSKAWEGGTAQWFLSGQVAMAGERAADYPLSPANWLKLVNGKSTSKLHMHGHGLLDCWILEKHRKLSDKSLDQLENENAYPAITTVSCFTGQFDEAKDPSIAESILRRPKAGAILVVCPSREGKPHFLNPRRDFRLMMTEGKMDGTTATMAGFWAQCLGSERKSSGEALMTVKAAMVPKAAQSDSFHLCLCELNLLGDPTLDLRAADPMTPKLNLPGAIAPKQQELQIRTDAPDATVCLWKGEELYQVATTGADGTALLTVAPASPGPILVTVSGTGLNAVTGEIMVR